MRMMLEHVNGLCLKLNEQSTKNTWFYSIFAYSYELSQKLHQL